MSEETSSVEVENSSQENISPDNISQSKDWRARLKELGKRAFELAEMERLGFWPPDPDAAARTAAAEEELKRLQEAMRPLRKQVRALEKEISEAGDIQKALAEIRVERIERVKKEREERKARKAKEREERAAQDKAWRGS